MWIKCGPATRVRGAEFAPVRASPPHIEICVTASAAAELLSRGHESTDAVRTCLSKYITFTGRAARSEYWYFVLFIFLAVVGRPFLMVY